MAKYARPVDRMSQTLSVPEFWVDPAQESRSSSGRFKVAQAPQLLFEDAFAFCALTIALFASVLGSLTPVLGMLLLFGSIVARPNYSFKVTISNGLILLLPIFALVSVLWSINPSISAYYAIQYVGTAMIGILIGASINRDQAFSGLFFAFALFTVASAVLGRSVGWGDGGPGGTAFAGLVASKNSMGDIAAIGAIASLAYFFRCLIRRQPLGALVAGALMVLQIYLTVASQSSGAVLGVSIGLGFLLVAGTGCAIPSQYRVLLGLILLIGLITLFATKDLWFQPLLESVAAAFGKSPTLTGRTPIWEDAARLMRERPTLGLGFSAFWVHGNLDAEGIWRSMGIDSRSGFNFHNSALEILVHLGTVGLALFASVFAICGVKLLAKTMYRPDIPLIFWSSFLIYQLSRMYAESRGLKLFDYGTITLFAGMAVAGSAIKPEVEPQLARASSRYR